jgi:hypothetical protein
VTSTSSRPCVVHTGSMTSTSAFLSKLWGMAESGRSFSFAEGSAHGPFVRARPSAREGWRPQEAGGRATCTNERRRLLPRPIGASKSGLLRDRAVTIVTPGRGCHGSARVSARASRERDWPKPCSGPGRATAGEAGTEVRRPCRYGPRHAVLDTRSLTRRRRALEASAFERGDPRREVPSGRNRWTEPVDGTERWSPFPGDDGGGAFGSVATTRRSRTSGAEGS